MTESTSTVGQLFSAQALQLPEVPNFWSVPGGWWSLLGSVVLAILLVLSIWRWRVRRLKAKRAAISLLQLEKETITASGAMEIVRQAVLSYYPRSRVSHLSGASWLTFLDSQVRQSIFRHDEQAWLITLYEKKPVEERERMVEQCANWLHQALPPKRGGRA